MLSGGLTFLKMIQVTFLSNGFQAKYSWNWSAWDRHLQTKIHGFFLKSPWFHTQWIPKVSVFGIKSSLFWFPWQAVDLPGLQWPPFFAVVAPTLTKARSGCSSLKRGTKFIHFLLCIFWRNWRFLSSCPSKWFATPCNSERVTDGLYLQHLTVTPLADGRETLVTSSGLFRKESNQQLAAALKSRLMARRALRF